MPAPPGGSPPRMDTKWLRNSFVYLIILVAIIALFFTVVQQGGTTDVKPIALNDLAQRIKQGQIKSIEVTDDRVVATASAPGGPDQKFTTRTGRDNFLDAMHNFGVTPEELSSVNYTVKDPPQISNWLSILVNLLPLIFFGAILLFMMRQAQGSNNQALSFGKSRARMFMGNKPTITFQDVAGVEEAKQELQEVVEFLKYPEKFAALGARIPKGVLLVGPPGTGKTLLSRAVAGEAGVPFFSISGSEFVEMFVGVGASRVRDLFDQAKRNAPCIVFVDEIDAVGRQRGAGLGGSHDEREQTLNQILVEMDGFDTNTNVIVIAATNRPDVLDPALIRPGRFDRQVILDAPDVRGRLDFQDATERMMLGGPERRSRVMTPKMKELVAYHEAGHAIVGHAMPKANPVHKVTIVPRGRAGGYTLSLPEEDSLGQTVGQFEAHMVFALGGRAAEELVLGDVTTGASGDIQDITRVARAMVTRYGMSEKLGPIMLGEVQEMIFLGREISEQRNYSEDTARAIDAEVKRLVDIAHQRALQILRNNMEVLHDMAHKLIEVETLDGEELRDVLSRVKRFDATSNGYHPEQLPNTAAA